MLASGPSSLHRFDAFDGVLVNTRFYIHSLLGTAFARRRGLRPIVLDHGSAYLTLGSSFADAVIARYEDAVTALLKRQGVDFYGISRKSCDWLRHFGIEARGIISNSIDADAYRAQASSRDFRSDFAIPRESMMAAFTGRLIPEKGIFVLLEAFKLLQDYAGVSKDGDDGFLIWSLRRWPAALGGGGVRVGQRSPCRPS